MICPKCGYKYPAVVVYGLLEDENGNEYPNDRRVYSAGDSLPAWGINGKYNGYFYEEEDWPTRFCNECRTRFAYEPERIAFGIGWDDAINIANKEAQQVNQWESIENIQEMVPYLEWGWFGFVMMGFDRAGLFDDEEVEIDEK